MKYIIYVKRLPHQWQLLFLKINNAGIMDCCCRRSLVAVE
jgi:hypothetical protein